jgi:hypothetical protein
VSQRSAIRKPPFIQYLPATNFPFICEQIRMPHWAPVRLFGLGTPADLLQLKNRQAEKE